MSAEDLDNSVAYEQLDDLEDDFEEVELELRKFLHSSVAPTHAHPNCCSFTPWKLTMTSAPAGQAYQGAIRQARKGGC